MGMQAHRTVPELFTDLISQAASLFRTEVRLARAEFSEKVTQARGGIAMIVAGVVFLIPALVILLEAAVAALVDQGFRPYAASLIVGASAFVIALIMALVGINRIRAENLSPRRTIEQLQNDAAVARNQLR